jgi:hypothetical protein
LTTKKEEQQAGTTKKETTGRDKMKITFKTLKGGKFEVDCEPSNTILEVKGIVVSSVVKK